MADVPAQLLLGQLLGVLEEGLEHSPKPWAYFSDTGLYDTLAGLSAAEASRVIGGSSVAAHARHVAFALAASSAWIRGEQVRPDWAESWGVREVDEAGWRQLQTDVRDRAAELRRAIENHATDGPLALGGALGAVAHLAYHLGAIRQKVAVLRSA